LEKKMINTDELKVTGSVNVVVHDESGKQKENYTIPNLVVNTGLAYIASRMKDDTATAMTHMAVGTDTTATAAGNTALGTQLGSRVSLTSTTVTSNSTAYVATFGAGVGTGALTEAGIFNASTSGTMLCRTVFAVINKGALDTMTITWTITIS
jgi:hypothetical protein